MRRFRALGYETIPLEISNPGQRSALTALWSENMSDRRIANVAEARLRWFYEENPVRPPRTFLSVHGDAAQVIGCGSTFTRQMWVKGQPLLAGIPCDFAVSKRHRLGGAAIGIQRALVDGSRAAGMEFLFGFPNKASLPILKRVGYQVVAGARGWVKPLRSLYKLKTYFKNPLVAKAASLVVDPGLRVLDRARQPLRRDAWRGEILEEADGRFDTLWERARGRYKLVGEKSSSFLNWRYTAFKTRRHLFFALIERETELLAGFVAYSVENRKVFIADLFATDAEGIVDLLLLQFASRMRREGHVSIFVNCAASPGFEMRLKRLGFVPATYEERSVVVYFEKDAPQALIDTVAAPDSWLMFDGEMDI